jgi:hypothetical protein
LKIQVKLGKYQHFKGNFYNVIGVARHSENPKEEFVVYQALYESKDFGKNTLWIRPKKMFVGKVVKDGKSVPRFKYVGKSR